MKKFFSLLLLLCCLPAAVLAEVDVMALQQTANMQVFPASNGVDTVIRPADQPFVGVTELEDGEMIAYLDYIDMPNANRVFLRLTISIVTPDLYAADTLALTVGKKTYAFSVQPEINEYDAVYYEDYAVCLTEESLPILQDIIKLGAKTEDAAALHEKYGLDDKPVRVTLSCEGMESICGSVVLPAESVKAVCDRYEEVGGMTQDFDAFEETWSVEIRQ